MSPVYMSLKEATNKAPTAAPKPKGLIDVLEVLALGGFCMSALYCVTWAVAHIPVVLFGG